MADTPTKTGRGSAVASPTQALRRDLRTPMAALVVSWTGCAVLLWAAALGAVLGTLVSTGVVSAAGAHGLFRLAGAPGLRPWHVLDGAVVGAGGTAATVAGAVFGSPVWALAWVAIGLSMALAVLGVLWRHEEALLRLRRARRPTMGELRRLAAAAQRAGAAVSGADLPRLLVVESPSPQIRAHVHHVVLSSALLDGADDEELAALLCHAQHHLESGAGLRRAFVVACGWPVLTLAAIAGRAGDGLVASRAADGRGGGSASRNRGLLRALTWLVLWPAGLLVHLVAASSERGTVSEEFEADARVRRAGLGSQLVAALHALPEAECGGAMDRAWAGPPMPVALRVERLEAARPLDGFFGGRAAAGPGDEPRWWCTLAGSGAAVLALTLGAVSSAGAALGAGGVVGDAAAGTAASYTVTYLDNAFRPSGLDQVIRRSVPLSLVSAVEAEAGTSTLAMVSALAAGAPSASRATALGCRELAIGQGSAAARVVVRVRWDYEVGGIAQRRVTTSVVALRLVDGRWQPISVPALVLAAGRSPGAAGFGPCAA